MLPSIVRRSLADGITVERGLVKNGPFRHWGQTVNAMGRFTGTKELYLLQDLNPKQVCAHAAVVSFYVGLRRMWVKAAEAGDDGDGVGVQDICDNFGVSTGALLFAHAPILPREGSCVAYCVEHD